MDDERDAVPEPIPVLPRTRSDDMTMPMHMIDHTIVRQDGPPDPPESWDDDVTDVDEWSDTMIIDVGWE